ncbi:MAG: flagellar motor switch protein FliG [Verrucomicrobia bacterium]|nr:flagellar motor switch protein FliG [Verrucomicrobiota bacterium]
MANAAESQDSSSNPVEGMTFHQKLACLMILLGQEGAASVLRGMGPVEMEAVSVEMAKIGLMDQPTQEAILQEFSDVALEASTAVRWGLDFTTAALEKAVGIFKANNIVTRVAPTRTPVAAMQEIVDMDPRQIANLIKNEQPQTVALILSYLPPEKAAQALAMIRTEVRDQVIERLAILVPTPIEAVEKLVSILSLKTGVRQTRALNQTGGLKAAAAILNALDKSNSKSLLVAIEERNPELVSMIQQKMFTFEDLSAIEPAGLQRILREVDLRELAVALKSASDGLKGALLGAISKRAAETVSEEMGLMGPLKLRDIEAAQMKIIEVVRRLESEGEINIGREATA